MSKPNSTAYAKGLKLAIALAAAMLAVSASVNWKTPGVEAAIQDLPEGKGVEIAREKCLTCHEADLIVSQRLSKQGWTREVEKMMRWGAAVKDAEKEVLVEYFSARFTLTKAAATNEPRGKQIFDDKCLVCHESDLVETQRLSKQGWTREVEKMIRWGAAVTNTEKEPLVEYLSNNYGLRPLKSAR